MLLGGLTGLIGIAICFFGVVLVTELITDDTLTAIAIFAVYSHPTPGLSITLLPTLWFTGRYAEKCLLREEKLLKVSFRYCLLTNVFIWTVFSLVFALGPLASVPGVIIPLVLFLTFLTLSTFTIGLMVCSVVKKRIKHRIASEATQL